ncbi:hypothetical protein E2C01_067473 [Portunus trituberculatus]|uniref:Uncharacterized protein n=1 Tax=Portunus trituberculatus TaxID=210409 RepID=A0A5B7HTQ1_PORTR|nr:hypothetical protein [Portunus trituberculatus]
MMNRNHLADTSNSSPHDTATFKPSIGHGVEAEHNLWPRLYTSVCQRCHSSPSRLCCLPKMETIPHAAHARNNSFVTRFLPSPTTKSSCFTSSSPLEQFSACSSPPPQHATIEDEARGGGGSGVKWEGHGLTGPAPRTSEQRHRNGTGLLTAPPGGNTATEVLRVVVVVIVMVVVVVM